MEEQKIAQDVSAYQVSMLLGDFYVIEATAVEGQDPDALVAAIDEAVAGLKTEASRKKRCLLAKTNWEASFYRRMLTISSKANQAQPVLRPDGRHGLHRQGSGSLHERVRTSRRGTRWTRFGTRGVAYRAGEGPLKEKVK